VGGEASEEVNMGFSGLSMATRQGI